jgi:hypothetical protein
MVSPSNHEVRARGRRCDSTGPRTGPVVTA